MWGGTQVEKWRERLGACKCARQGSHLGSLRLSSSAQGPRWGREGGGEGEEEQPLSQPGDLSLQERVLVVLRHTALGNRLLHPVAWGSAVGSPPVILLQTTPAPSWRPFPRPEGDQSGAAWWLQIPRRGVLQSGSQVLKHRVLTPWPLHFAFPLRFECDPKIGAWTGMKSGLRVWVGQRAAECGLRSRTPESCRQLSKHFPALWP